MFRKECKCRGKQAVDVADYLVEITFRSKDGDEKSIESLQKGMKSEIDAVEYASYNLTRFIEISEGHYIDIHYYKPEEFLILQVTNKRQILE